MVETFGPLVYSRSQPFGPIPLSRATVVPAGSVDGRKGRGSRYVPGEQEWRGNTGSLFREVPTVF